MKSRCVCHIFCETYPKGFRAMPILQNSYISVMRRFVSQIISTIFKSSKRPQRYATSLFSFLMLVLHSYHAPLVFSYLHDINVMICCLCFSYSSEVFFLSDKRYIQSQQDWIEADLSAANNNRHITPWIVAYGHRPMYCSNDDGDDCTKNTSLVRLGFVMFDMLELVLYCLSFPLG